MNKNMKTEPYIKNSQNFLHSEQLVSQLIANSSITKNDLVYEIGGGKGIITQGLAHSCHKVISIEIDKKMANELAKNFDEVPNVEIVCADFLSYYIPDTDCKFFSNIPFNITAEILGKVLELKKVQDIYFVMQYEAFLKYAGAPYYKECLKSLQYKPFFEAALSYEFNPTDFKPVPKARIVLAHFYPKDKPDISNENAEMYRDFLVYIFNEKGSTIKAKFKKIFSYEQIKRAEKTIGFAKEDGISQLSYQQWLLLFNTYLKYVPHDKKNLVKGAYCKLSTQQQKINKVHRNRNYRVRCRNRNKKYHKQDLYASFDLRDKIIIIIKFEIMVKLKMIFR